MLVAFRTVLGCQTTIKHRLDDENTTAVEKKILDVYRHRVKRLSHLWKCCILLGVRRRFPEDLTPAKTGYN